MVDAKRGAHPGWSTACAHGLALDTGGALLRSWLRSTPDTARRRPAEPSRPCSCRPAHSALHGCLWPCSCACEGQTAFGLMRSRTSGFGGRDGREWRYVLGADSAEEGLAVRELGGFATLDVRHHLPWHVGVTYGTGRDQRHEDRGTAPAANRRRVHSSDRQTMCLLRRTDGVRREGGSDVGSLASVRAHG